MYSSSWWPQSKQLAYKGARGVASRALNSAPHNQCSRKNYSPSSGTNFPILACDWKFLLWTKYLSRLSRLYFSLPQKGHNIWVNLRLAGNQHNHAPLEGVQRFVWFVFLFLLLDDSGHQTFCNRSWNFYFHLVLLSTNIKHLPSYVLLCCIPSWWTWSGQ